MSSWRDARVKLSNILVAAGYKPFKCLELIKYPKVKEMSYRTLVNGVFVSISWSDDHRISWINFRKSARRIVFPGADLQRYFAVQGGSFYNFKETKGAHGSRFLDVDSFIKLDTFDGWGDFYYNKYWTINFLWDDNTVSTVTGGEDMGHANPRKLKNLDKTHPFNHPDVYDYFSNGGASIEKPMKWNEPYFLTNLKDKNKCLA